MSESHVHKPITKENVFDNVLDEQSVLLLKDGDVVNRLNFLKNILFDAWFDDLVFSKFQLLRSVALKKGLLDEPQRRTIIELPNLTQRFEPDYQ
jgi:hypothetical protein